MNSLSPIHPSIVLLEGILKSMSISVYRLSKITEIPQTRISQIIKRKWHITPDNTLRLDIFIDMSPNF